MKLRDFAIQHLSLSKEDFIARQPRAFLMLPGGFSNEDSGQGFRTPASGDVTAQIAREMHGYELVPLLKRDGGSGGFMITVGRTQRSDVMFPDGRISKFHAYFRLDPTTGRFFVVDAGSSNGTSVKGRRLQPNVPVEIKPRDEIVFAAFLLTVFHTSASLFDELKLLESLFR